MSLNERGTFYHLLGDAGGSVAVIVSVLVVEFTGLRVLDPITALLIAAVIAWSAGKLLRRSGAIFRHRTPFDVGEARTTVSRLDGIDGVTGFHVWQICSEITLATTHVETSIETMDEAQTLTGSTDRPSISSDTLRWAIPSGRRRCTISGRPSPLSGRLAPTKCATTNRVIASMPSTGCETETNDQNPTWRRQQRRH